MKNRLAETFVNFQCGQYTISSDNIDAFTEERSFRSGWDLSPVPFPEGKGCLLAGMTPRGLVNTLGGEGFSPSPVGEGWGEVLN
jgi:hypothetical protein